jgi:hypothetical protein
MSVQHTSVADKVLEIYADIVKTQMVVIPQNELDGKQKLKQKELLESITLNIVQAAFNEMIQNLIRGFNYQYMDNPRPELATVLEIIGNSQASFKIKERFDEMLQDELVIFRQKEERAISRMQRVKEKLGGNSNGTLKLEASKTRQTSLRKASVDHEPDVIQKSINAEMELLTHKITTELTSEERLERIKEFLVAQKGSDFVASFADSELLAFPLWAMIGLESSDLEYPQEGFKVDNLNGRKFSPAVLECIQGIRFNKNREERIKSELLTPTVLRDETPRFVLTTLLQINSGTIRQLSSNGDLH